MRPGCSSGARNRSETGMQAVTKRTGRPPTAAAAPATPARPPRYCSRQRGANPGTDRPAKAEQTGAIQTLRFEGGSGQVRRSSVEAAASTCSVCVKTAIQANQEAHAQSRMETNLGELVVVLFAAQICRQSQHTTRVSRQRPHAHECESKVHRTRSRSNAQFTATRNEAKRSRDNRAQDSPSKDSLSKSSTLSSASISARSNR